jgi:uncharacterized protein (DUF433 family)
MKKEELLKRISIDPNVCFGKPCIRGHRIWVSLILDFLASGMTISELLEQYPGLEEADIYACIAYGAEMARERYVEVPGKAQETRNTSFVLVIHRSVSDKGHGTPG